MAKSDVKQSNPIPHLASWRRKFLGFASLMLIVFGIIGLLYFKGKQSEGLYLISVAMWRVGLTIGALWLAFPQLADFFTKFPPILVGTYLIGLGFIAWRPRTIGLILPAIAVLTLLHLSGFLLPRNQRAK